MGLSFGEKLEWVNSFNLGNCPAVHLCLQSLSIVASVFGLQQLPLPFSGFSCALDHSEDHTAFPGLWVWAPCLCQLYQTSAYKWHVNHTLLLETP